jgi:Flp pilus assembly protein TadD
VLVRQLCFGLALLMAGGCVTTGTNSLAQRFVRQGKPAVDLGGPRPQASRANRAPAPLEHASINSVSSRMSSSISSLESVHPDLREATMRLRFAPTPGHHLEVARIYRRLKIFDTAHDYLATSLAVNGPHPEVLDALARLWRDWGQPGQGLSYAHRAVYLDPTWATPHNTLGTVLFALGQRTEARKQFEVAVSLEPNASWALQNLCVAYQAEGRTREAISTCRKADATRRKAPRASKESR